MPVATDRLEFAPPPQPGMVRAFALAVVAHLLLMLALTWGISWNREAENISAEAELWSSLPQQAAPKLIETPPPPPQPEVKEQPPPKPEPLPREADIALEREKLKKLAEAREKREDLERQKKADAQKKQELAKKETAEKKKQDDLAMAKARQQDEAKRLEAQRQENLKRMQGLAGASGSPNATGKAMQSSGPSGNWAGMVRGRVKPNIVFTDDIAGNPTAEVEVRTAPDGLIVGQPRLVKSSGVKAWDQAVINALIKTERLPRDVDGRVHTPVILTFRPRD